MSQEIRARARARALAKFTPIHHWEEGELKSKKTQLLEEMQCTPFLHDVGAKQLMVRLMAMH